MSWPKHTPGWDHFCPLNADEFKYKKCVVCGSDFDVVKGVSSSTSVGEARVNKKHLHDEVTCPHAGEIWHNQALAILKEARETSSGILSKLLRSEAEWIVSMRKPTIDGFDKKSPWL